MAAMASTLPLSHKSQYNVATTPAYNEFGIPRSSSAVNTRQDWDEEVVPALRKKLEEDSQILARRINRMDHVESSSTSAYLQTPVSPSYRPSIRSRPSAEILQDGLGSDDLIPSEWVTGSSAQFQSLTPRSRSIHMDERRSPVGSPYSKTSPPLYQHHNISPSASPLSPYFPPQEIPSSSSANHLDDGVLKARERAKQLVRERSQTLLQSSLPKAGAVRSPHRLDCEGTISQSDRVNERRQRERSLSIPSKVERYGRDKERSRDTSPSGKGQSSQESLREAHDVVSHRDMRKMKSNGTLSPSQQPRQDIVRAKSRHTEINIPTSQTFPRYNTSSMHDARVDDEFGPLGATPKRRLPSGFCEDETARRTSSNPWDEEMLPAVKRRLEQQRMLEELEKDRDEDLVDMWDRNGLPLRKSPVTVKARSSTRSESINKLSSPHSPTKSVRRGAFEEEIESESVAIDDGPQIHVPAQVQAQRLKRLQEQLDLGLFASPTQSNGEVLAEKDPSVEVQDRVEEPTMVYQGAESIIKAEKESQAIQSTPPIRRSEVDAEKRRQLSHQRSESKGATGEKEIQGGCCNCLVM